MNIKKHIPNFVTCINVLFGCFAIKYAFELNWEMVIVCTGVALLADFADGFVARLLNVSSEIGKELDSLADAITFGLLPGMIMYHVIKTHYIGNDGGLIDESFYPHLAFMIPIFSVLRLAKFNVDTEQSHNFKGIPTPASTAFFLSVPFVVDEYQIPFSVLALCILAICFLMVSDVKLIALKFKNYSVQDNWEKYTLVFVSITLLALFTVQAFFLLIPFYVGLSIVYFLLNRTETE